MTEEEKKKLRAKVRKQHGEDLDDQAVDEIIKAGDRPERPGGELSKLERAIYAMAGIKSAFKPSDMQSEYDKRISEIKKGSDTRAQQRKKQELEDYRAQLRGEKTSAQKAVDEKAAAEKAAAEKAAAEKAAAVQQVAQNKPTQPKPASVSGGAPFVKPDGGSTVQHRPIIPAAPKTVDNVIVPSNGEVSSQIVTKVDGNAIDRSQTVQRNAASTRFAEQQARHARDYMDKRREEDTVRRNDRMERLTRLTDAFHKNMAEARYNNRVLETTGDWEALGRRDGVTVTDDWKKGGASYDARLKELGKSAREVRDALKKGYLPGQNDNFNKLMELTRAARDSANGMTVAQMEGLGKQLSSWIESAGKKRAEVQRDVDLYNARNLRNLRDKYHMADVDFSDRDVLDYDKQMKTKMSKELLGRLSKPESFKDAKSYFSAMSELQGLGVYNLGKAFRTAMKNPSMRAAYLQQIAAAGDDIAKRESIRDRFAIGALNRDIGMKEAADSMLAAEPSLAQRIGTAVTPPRKPELDVGFETEATKAAGTRAEKDMFAAAAALGLDKPIPGPDLPSTDALIAATRSGTGKFSPQRPNLDAVRELNDLIGPGERDPLTGRTTFPGLKALNPTGASRPDTPDVQVDVDIPESAIQPKQPKSLGIAAIEDQLSPGYVDPDSIAIPLVPKKLSDTGNDPRLQAIFDKRKAAFDTLQSTILKPL